MDGGCLARERVRKSSRGTPADAKEYLEKLSQSNPRHYVKLMHEMELGNWIHDLKSIHFDHIVPKAFGGGDTIWNLTAMPSGVNTHFSKLITPEKLRYIGKDVITIVICAARVNRARLGLADAIGF